MTRLTSPLFLLLFLSGLLFSGCGDDLLIGGAAQKENNAAGYADTPTPPSPSASPPSGSAGTQSDQGARNSGAAGAPSDSNSQGQAPESDVEPPTEDAPEETSNWYQLSTDDSTSMASAQMFKAHYGSRALKAHEFLNYYDPPAGLRAEEAWAINEEISGIKVALKADLLSEEVLSDCGDDSDYSDTPTPDEEEGVPSTPDPLPPEEDCRQTEPQQRAEVLFHMNAPPTPIEERRGWNVFLCVDVSGSMGGDKIAFTRRALRAMLSHFKEGDRLSLVTFDSDAHHIFSNREFSANQASIEEVFSNLRTGSATNMLAGLELTYELAQTNFDPSLLQRVILFSDGNANVGHTHIEEFSRLTRINGQEGIYLSGVGVGQDYDWERMDRLTDAGKGAHVFLPNRAEVNLIFGDYFPKLVEVAADQISVELTLPAGIGLESFTGEEVSTNPEERLQNIILAAGDDITFLARFVISSPEALEQPASLTLRFRPLATAEEVTRVFEVPAFRNLIETPGPLMERTRLVSRFAQLATGAAGPGVSPWELEATLDQEANPDWGLRELQGLLQTHF